MEYKSIIFEVKEGIGYVKFNRPSVLNAINETMIQELSSIIDTAENDDSIKCIVLTGQGKGFIAGADIEMLNKMNNKEGRDWVVYGHNLINKIEYLDKPVIAAINGYCIGGGNEIAMACDFRIASSKAKFGQPEVNLGIIPGYGGTQRLPRLVGKGMAKYLIMTGEIINAKEAFEIGLIEKLVEEKDLMEYTEKIAKIIIKKTPLALKIAKRTINNGVNMDLISGTAYEIEGYTTTFATKERLKGMEDFLNRKKKKSN